MNNQIALAIIGVISVALGIIGSKIELKPQIEKQKHDTEIFKQEKTKYLFEKYEEDNKTLREELAAIKQELKALEEAYELEEEKLNAQIKSLKEELELSDQMSSVLERDLEESHTIIDGLQDTIEGLIQDEEESRE